LRSIIQQFAPNANFNAKTKHNDSKVNSNMVQSGLVRYSMPNNHFSNKNENNFSNKNENSFSLSQYSQISESQSNNAKKIGNKNQ
jgi:hypothetical protein